MKDRTIIVFSPHPDDETLGCGGTIAKRLNDGSEVWVVLMTDGRHAYSKVFGMNVDPTPEELVAIRNREVRRAMEILGLKKENLIFLGFEDGTLEQHRDEAEKLVAEILKRHPPMEVYCTYEKDIHPDHLATSRVVSNLIKKKNLQTRQYEYSISRKYGRLGRLMESPLNPMRYDKLSVDISAFLPLKEEAIKAFRSQISIMSEGQERPVIKDLTRFLKNKETFFICK